MRATQESGGEWRTEKRKRLRDHGKNDRKTIAHMRANQRLMMDSFIKFMMNVTSDESNLHMIQRNSMLSSNSVILGNSRVLCG